MNESANEIREIQEGKAQKIKRFGWTQQSDKAVLGTGLRVHVSLQGPRRLSQDSRGEDQLRQAREKPHSVTHHLEEEYERNRSYAGGESMTELRKACGVNFYSRIQQQKRRSREAAP